jgi:hypothetical protein
MSELRKIEHMLLGHGVVKAVSSAIIAGALDNYINEGGNMDARSVGRSAGFGTIVGGAIYASNYIAPSFTNMVPMADTSFFNGKTLEHRLIEITLGSASAVALGRSGVLGTVIMDKDIPKKIGIILIADVLGEYVADYVHSKPLSYLQ